jgi:hypothetical protein
LATARQLLTVGVAPLSEAGAPAEEAAARHAGQPGAVHRARALFDLGPAGAVDNVHELYEAGLPVGLPGRLAAVALHHRAELMERVSAQHERRRALIDARREAAAGRAKQGKMRRAGEYDRKHAKATAADEPTARGGAPAGSGSNAAASGSGSSAAADGSRAARASAAADEARADDERAEDADQDADVETDADDELREAGLDDDDDPLEEEEQS